MPTRSGVTVAVLAVLATGCAVRTKATVIDAAIEDPHRRREMFEATLRVLDQNPEYVDEFFRLALEHPITLERFIARTAERLDHERLAELTAEHLAKNPASLERILIATLEAAKDDPAALDAIARAIEQRPKPAAKALATRPEAVAAVTSELLEAIAGEPAAMEAMLTAMGQYPTLLSSALAQHPATLGALIDGLLVHAKRDPDVARLLIGRTVRAMEGEVLTKVTAAELAREPEVMRRLLIRTLETAEGSPQAKEAIAAAIAERPQIAARIIASRPEALRSTMVATIDAVDHDPAARDALLQAVSARSEALAKLLASDRRVLLDVTEDLLQLAVENASLARRILPLLRRGDQAPPAAGTVAPPVLRRNSTNKQ